MLLPSVLAVVTALVIFELVPKHNRNVSITNKNNDELKELQEKIRYLEVKIDDLQERLPNSSLFLDDHA